MTKKQRQAEQILAHGFKLLRIFPRATEPGPKTICQRLFRIENRAHTAAENLCNGRIGQGTADKIFARCLALADDILKFVKSGIPVIVNSDPRGCALKIDDAWVREHSPDIPRDWGGYGLIAPEITGEAR